MGSFGLVNTGKSGLTGGGPANSRASDSNSEPRMCIDDTNDGYDDASPPPTRCSDAPPAGVFTSCKNNFQESIGSMISLGRNVWSKLVTPCRPSSWPSSHREAAHGATLAIRAGIGEDNEIAGPPAGLQLLL